LRRRLWILIQFVNGIGSIAATPETAGVAYLAHIGGFAAGVVLVSLFASGRRAGTWHMPCS
jgi:membrane associated rhomboid family serine protease